MEKIDNYFIASASNKRKLLGNSLVENSKLW